MVRGTIAAVIAVVTAMVMVILVPLSSAPATAAGSHGALVRVDQLGYPSAGPKVAYLMSPTGMSGDGFEVVDSSGAPIFTGSVGANRGKWNATYRYVYPLAFTPVTTSGTDTIVVDGPDPIASPAFPIGPPTTLWSQALANSLSFYQNERDGPDYIPRRCGRLRRTWTTSTPWPTLRRR